MALQAKEQNAATPVSHTKPFTSSIKTDNVIGGAGTKI